MSQATRQDQYTRLDQNFRYDHSFVNDLPADPETSNYCRQVQQACYSKVRPTPVKQPKTLALSREVIDLLGMDWELAQSQAFADVFAGNKVLDGMAPFAACYGGHQFGYWAGQLGDGRAMTLAEVLTPDNDRYELQLKGAGPTPYSRNSDGRAVLRSSLREFLCSEAMHHLGVPTTRALSLVTTGDDVMRDMFYDGHPEMEPGAIVCRVAPSFIRFGNFEILASRREYDLLERFLKYTLKRHYPQFLNGANADIAGFLTEVCKRTCDMVIHWMRVGFVHGVMNTDNMSILGQTIDYGPYGWLEPYDTQWTPNTTDAEGRRYAFGQQPQIAMWNLVKLANALVPLVGTPEPLQERLDQTFAELQIGYRTMMARKFGLILDPQQQLDPSDESLTTFITEASSYLSLEETDMTIFFRGLANLEGDPETLSDDAILAPIQNAFYQTKPVESRTEHVQWLRTYLKLANQSQTTPETRKKAMDHTNPKYVPRNYLAQQAIDKATEGDASELMKLLDILRNPYAEQPEFEADYAAKRPDWAANRPGCSMLSCSS